MKKFLCLILVLVMCVALVACAQDDSAAEAVEGEFGHPVTNELIVWSFMNEGEPIGLWHQQAAAYFEEHFPDVRVEVQMRGRAVVAQYRAILGDPNSPDFPDIIMQSDDLLEGLAREGLIRNLDAYVSGPAWNSDQVWGSTFMPYFWDLIQIDGSHYFVPESLYTNGWFYDAALFRELGLSVPETWEEFLDVAETLKANNIYPVALDGMLDYYNTWFFTAIAMRLAGPDAVWSAFTGETRFADDPVFLEAARLTAEFWDRGLFQPGAEGSNFPAAQALITQGTAGMIHVGAWFPAEMSDVTPPDFEMRMFPFPSLPGEQYSNLVELWANSQAITTGARNVHNAINWLRIISSAEIQERKVAVYDASAVIGVTLPVQLGNLFDIIENSEHTTTVRADIQSAGAPTNNAYAPLLTELLLGQISPEDFIAAIDDRLAAEWRNVE